MQTLWTRFEDWLNTNANHLINDLNDGANDQQFEELEQLIGTVLPADFKDFYKIHDGQDPEGEGLIEAEELLSLKRIIGEWTIWKDLHNDGDFEDDLSDPDVEIKDDWWNPLWIPFTYDGAGNHYCLDLDPTEKGKKGQVIRMWHDSEERELIADSFLEWVSSYISDLEGGEYVYSADWGGIIHKENATEYEEND